MAGDDKEEAMTEVLERELGVSREEMAVFDETAAQLGMSGSEAMRVLLRRFNAAGGFPFAMRYSPQDAAYDALYDEELAEEIRNQVKEMESNGGMTLEEFSQELKKDGLLV